LFTPLTIGIQPPESVFQLFDKVLLLTAFGEVAFFGPAHEAVNFISTSLNKEKQSKYTSAEFLCRAFFLALGSDAF
jgi:hypothetical protein